MGDSLQNPWSRDSMRRCENTYEIDSSSAATLTPLAAKTGYTQIVTKVFLVAEGADTLTFKSTPATGSATDLTGAMVIKTDGILDLPEAFIKGRSGGAVTLTKSAAVAVKGYVNIVAIPD